MVPVIKRTVGVSSCPKRRFARTRQPNEPFNGSLNEMAAVLSTGNIKSTATERMGKMNPANLRKAHALLENNKAKGKLTLVRFKTIGVRLRGHPANMG